MNPTVAEVAERLRTAGLCGPAGTSGCSPEAISHMESELGVTLPGAYLDYLRALGADAGESERFMCGSDLALPGRRPLTAEGRELALESGVVLPDSAFVFLMHQGCTFAFFCLGEGDDPPVSVFEEGEPVRPLDMSFSAWLSLAAGDEIEAVRNRCE